MSDKTPRPAGAAILLGKLIGWTIAGALGGVGLLAAGFLIGAFAGAVCVGFRWVLGL